MSANEKADLQNSSIKDGYDPKETLVKLALGNSDITSYLNQSFIRLASSI